MSVAILSDLDGVLVDSHDAIMRVWSAWGARHGIAAARIEAVMPGRPSEEVVAELAPHLDAAAEGERINGLEAADSGGVVALPGADEHAPSVAAFLARARVV